MVWKGYREPQTITEQRFLEVEELFCREFYEYYRQRRRKVAKGIDQQILFEKAIKGLLRRMNQLMCEKKGGLYLKGFGYLCHLPARTWYTRKRHIFDKQEKYLIHKEAFFADEKLKGWYIDFWENKNMNPKRKDYKLYFDVIESYYSAMQLTNQLDDYNSRRDTREK